MHLLRTRTCFSLFYNIWKSGLIPPLLQNSVYVFLHWKWNYNFRRDFFFLVLRRSISEAPKQPTWFNYESYEYFMVFIHLLGDFLPSFVAAFVCKKKKLEETKWKKKEPLCFTSKPLLGSEMTYSNFTAIVVKICRFPLLINPFQWSWKERNTSAERRETIYKLRNWRL